MRPSKVGIPSLPLPLNILQVLQGARHSFSCFSMPHSNPLSPKQPCYPTHRLHLPDKVSWHQPQHLAQRTLCVSQIQSHTALHPAPSGCHLVEAVRLNTCTPPSSLPGKQAEAYLCRWHSDSCAYPPRLHPYLICIPSGYILPTYPLGRLPYDSRWL